MLIIGIGNEFRGDDTLGISVVDTLEDNYPFLGEYIREQDDLIRLMDIWKGNDVVIVDAIFSEKMEVGHLYQAFTYDQIIEDRDILFSTHGIGLIQVLALSKQLDKMPASIFFLGVVGSVWGIGELPSDEVLQVIPEVCDRVVKYVDIAHSLNVGGLQAIMKELTKIII